MAFQIKNFVSIVASMLNRMKITQNQITDFNIGAVGRTLVEAPAAEIDQLYQQMLNGLLQAIPVSVYKSFSFPPLSASAATGTIVVTIASSASAILIPAGTQFSSTVSQTVYASTNDVIIPIGNTVANVTVSATTVGSSTNIINGVPFTMTPSPSGFVSASNPSPFVNAIDAETPSQQKIRFNSFIASLPRGTVAALYYGMSLATVVDSNNNVIERVVYSSVVEPYLTDITQPIALVNCYIHNGIGSTSSALLMQAKKIIYGYYTAMGVAVPGYKAAGVNVQMYVATEVPVNVSGSIVALPGYSLSDVTVGGVTIPGLDTLAESAVYTYLQTLPIGSSALMAEIYAIVMAIPGVYNYLPTLPTTDQTVTNTQKIVPGTVEIT